MFRVLILLVALAAGGIAAWLSTGTTPAQIPVAAANAPVPEIKLQEVLVATVDLEKGKRLTDQDVRWQSWPDGPISAAFIDRTTSPQAIETLTGSVVRSQIMLGEPIREDKLASSEAGFLSAILPSGKRAVAVRVSAENSAGGFILPNDHVDVIHTTSPQGGADVGSVSRTIIGNVRVLAIDQNVDQVDEVEGSDAHSVKIGKTATLELEPVQTEIIIAAETSGLLSLALRSAADNDEKMEIERHRQGADIVRIIRTGRTETEKTK